MLIYDRIIIVPFIKNYSQHKKIMKNRIQLQFFIVILLMAFIIIFIWIQVNVS